MQMFSQNPAAAYRRVALEARIEASDSADLTRICLEEAYAALGQALRAVEQPLPACSEVIPRYSRGYRDALSRAQTILLWLAQSVAPGHPLGASLTAFYGGLASQIGANCLQADARSIAQIQSDISDTLEAAGWVTAMFHVEAKLCRRHNHLANIAISRSIPQ